jgi:hypothetical protein
MEEESSAVAMVNYFTNCAAQLRDRSGRTRHVTLPDSVADPGCLSRIQIFSNPDHGSASKNLSILTQKIVSKLSEI